MHHDVDKEGMLKKAVCLKKTSSEIWRMAAKQNRKRVDIAEAIGMVHEGRDGHSNRRLRNDHSEPE
eukprot:Nk52_evm1s2350 gene=Nk52_evmTU1s2350